MKRINNIPVEVNKETGNVEYYCQLVNLETPDESSIVYLVNNSVDFKSFLNLAKTSLSASSDICEAIKDEFWGANLVVVSVKNIVNSGFRVYKANSHEELCNFDESLDYVVFVINKKTV